MAFWLAGFSDDPTQPITGGKRKKLFDLDASRLFTQGFLDGRGVYVPRDKPGSPYIYIDSRLYKKIDGTPQTWPPAPATYTTNSGDARTIEIATYRAQQMPNGTFFNEDTFQILCAGRDEKFGTDDDLSNFWPGTRLDYIDSVK
jgi:hypothetical protein